MSLALVAALKRNDRVQTTAEVLKALGHDERAEEIGKATRATVAFFDKAFKGLREDDEGEAPTETKDPTDLDYANKDQEKSLDEKVAKAADDFKAVEKALKKGKGKKALKLIKAMEDGGSRGSVIKALKAKAKAL